MIRNNILPGYLYQSWQLKWQVDKGDYYDYIKLRKTPSKFAACYFLKSYSLNNQIYLPMPNINYKSLHTGAVQWVNLHFVNRDLASPFLSSRVPPSEQTIGFHILTRGDMIQYPTHWSTLKTGIFKNRHITIIHMPLQFLHAPRWSISVSLRPSKKGITIGKQAPSPIMNKPLHIKLTRQ